MVRHPGCLVLLARVWNQCSGHPTAVVWSLGRRASDLSKRHDIPSSDMLALVEVAGSVCDLAAAEEVGGDLVLSRHESVCENASRAFD